MLPQFLIFSAVTVSCCSFSFLPFSVRLLLNASHVCHWSVADLVDSRTEVMVFIRWMLMPCESVMSVNFTSNFVHCLINKVFVKQNVSCHSIVIAVWTCMFGEECSKI